MVENKRWRTIIFYKAYFSDFFVRQRLKVQQKITWTFDLIEEHERVPEIYLKHLKGTDGLYEIRDQIGWFTPSKLRSAISLPCVSPLPFFKSVVPENPGVTNFQEESISPGFPKRSAGTQG